MSTLVTAPGLSIWELEFEDGSIRHHLAGSLDSLIDGNTPCVRALRLAAYDGGNDPAPILGSLVPATAKVGAAPFTLRVLGQAFRRDTEIVIDGAPVVTTYVSATEISTAIAKVTGPPRSSTVWAQSASGKLSNTLPFAITASAAEEPPAVSRATTVQP